MQKADLRRWVENRRAVDRFEREHLAEAWGTPEHAIAAALALVALDGRLHGWPRASDPASDLEDLATWQRFARLRTRLAPR